MAKKGSVEEDSGLVQAAMNRVLMAEAEAEQRVVLCRQEAAQLVLAAREEARRITQRADRRIGEVRNAGSRASQRRVQSFLQEAASRQRAFHNHPDLTGAVNRLAVVLTGGDLPREVDS